MFRFRERSHCAPVEVTAPLGGRLATLAGVHVRRARLMPAEVEEVRGLPATCGLRTMIDLAARTPLLDAVIALDMAFHTGLVEPTQMQAQAEARVARRGVRQLRYALALAEPATESPMETRLRLLLVGAGLARPEAQATLRSPEGRFLARVDFLYRDRGLVLEFDGSTHKDSIVSDARRNNELLAAGYRVLRFTSADVLGRPRSVIEQVSTALAA